MQQLRRRFTVTGQVQGVGFRPFVYRIALERDLTGSVKNTPEGVIIEVQGRPGSNGEVTDFGRALREEIPPLARIVTLDEEDLTWREGEEEFRIEASTAGEGHSVLISPDTATCEDCLRDMFAPENKGTSRWHYPFTNCTNCGPRYTITRAIPYDRDKTSMACFPLCPECGREYSDPLDRRFHAQPNACRICGPRVWLTAPDCSGAPDGSEIAADDEAVRLLAQALAEGKIAAIKGLGGFHLSCLAADASAVLTLRERKNRRGKPLALMVPDLATARSLARVSEREAELLSGTARPIVLLEKRTDSGSRAALLSPEICPDTPLIGVMLPYTPLHHLIFHRLAEAAPDTLPALVMTSGNLSSEPIALGNREAFARMRDIADLYLFHNRDILIRTDDSVVRVTPGTDSEPVPHEPADDAPQAGGCAGGADPVLRPADSHPEIPDRPDSPASPAPTAPPTPADPLDGLHFYRRARGYTPSPVFLAPLPSGEGAPSILAVGPELKNTLCVTKGDQAFPSQHIGDMENLETLDFFREIAVHLPAILQTRPEAVVRDLHPDFLTSRFAGEYAAEHGVPEFALQHHYAHAHAVLAENRFEGRAVCLCLDGTGYGEDGTVWGGECLTVDTQSLEHRRTGHIAPVLLPGGDAAAREPWRMAESYLHAAGETDAPDEWPWLDDFGAGRNLVRQMLERRINSPATTSCGRLFDAVASLLGLCQTIAYEGQAAIILEAAQDRSESGAYSCPVLSAEAGETGGLHPCTAEAGIERNTSDSADSDDRMPERTAAPDHVKSTAKEPQHGSTAASSGPVKHSFPDDRKHAPEILDTLTLFREVLADLRSGTAVPVIARRFHLGLAQGLCELAARACKREGTRHVGLSGGVMHNMTLSVVLPALLSRRGLSPLLHSRMPPGDACVSLGQAAWGRKITALR